MAMVRLARKPIEIPSGVVVSFDTKKARVGFGDIFREISLPDGVSLDINGNLCSFSSNGSCDLAKLGTVVARFKNLIQDIKSPCIIEISLIGIGFKAFLSEGHLVLLLGFSHLVMISIPKEVAVSIKDLTKIEIAGFVDEVTLFANDVISTRPWDPCERKGVVLTSSVPFLRKKVKKEKK